MNCLKIFVACSVVLLFYIMLTRPYGIEPLNVKPINPVVGEISDVHLQTGIGERITMNIDTGLTKINTRKNQEITKIVELTTEYDGYINNGNVNSLQLLKKNELILMDPDLDQHINTSIGLINDIKKIKSNIQVEKEKTKKIESDGNVLKDIKSALSENANKVDLSDQLHTRLHFYPNFEDMISKLLTNSKLAECKDKDFVCYSKYKN